MGLLCLFGEGKYITMLPVPGCTASNGRMTDESVGMDLEGSGSGVTEVLTQNSTEWTE